MADKEEVLKKALQTTREKAPGVKAWFVGTIQQIQQNPREALLSRAGVLLLLLIATPLLAVGLRYGIPCVYGRVVGFAYSTEDSRPTPTASFAVICAKTGDQRLARLPADFSSWPITRWRADYAGIPEFASGEREYWRRLRSEDGQAYPARVDRSGNALEPVLYPFDPTFGAAPPTPTPEPVRATGRPAPVATPTPAIRPRFVPATD